MCANVPFEVGTVLKFEGTVWTLKFPSKNNNTGQIVRL